MRVLGVDGWKKRWVAVALEEGVVSEISLFETLDEVSRSDDTLAAIGIDVPIGLPEAPPRAADQEARSFVGARRSSVFASPPAFCLDQRWTVYREANQECRAKLNGGISAQSFALLKNIREAARIAATDSRIHEVHPEVCFCAMNDRTPLEFTKKSWNGQRERLDLLAAQGIRLPDRLPLDVGRIPVDDLLDAAAAAWTAYRIAKNQAQWFPERAPAGANSRIWF